MNKIHKIIIRVRYGETDQMGFVYYGNFALYFEQARTEMLRNVGFSYKKMEEVGIFLPVVNMNTRYLKSAKYDDLLTIETFIKEIPNRKITFFHKVYNEENILLNKSEIVLVFMNKLEKLITCPKDISIALNEFVKFPISKN